MPTYEHLCLNEQCNHQWEDMYSIKAIPPTTCPKCNQETAQRLISGGSGKGKVELYGADLVASVKQSAADYKKEVYSSERAYSNAIGENVYQKLQTTIDKQKR